MDKRKKYKKKQKDNGIDRLEIMVPHELKAKFESMASELAKEYVTPSDERQKLTKAKIQLMAELLENINHEFFTLKDMNAKQQKLIDALSPSFHQKPDEDRPIPPAIQELPDNFDILKQHLTNTYIEKQSLHLKCAELERRARQYRQLYEAQEKYNEELRCLLDIKGINIAT